TTARRSLDSRGNINTPHLIGVLPHSIRKVSEGDGFVEFFEGLSTQRAALPDFGGNTTVAGRFTSQVVVDKSGNIILQNPQPGKAGNLGLTLAGLEGPARLGLDM